MTPISQAVSQDVSEPHFSMSMWSDSWLKEEVSSVRRQATFDFPISRFFGFLENLSVRFPFKYHSTFILTDAVKFVKIIPCFSAKSTQR